MVATLGSALSLPWVGKLVDRYSPATVTLIIVPLLALGAVGMAYVQHIVVLGFVIYVLRLFGQGMMTQNGVTATGRWFSASRGRAISLVTLGHNAGEAVLPFLFVIVAACLGWRNAWLVSAMVLVVFALPVITKLVAVERQPESKETNERDTALRHWTRIEVIRDPLFWLTLLGVLAPAFIGTTVFFHQIYLVELRDWSLPVFASAFSVMAVCKIIFGLISGGLIDRFTAVKLLPVFLVPLALSCFALGGLEAQWSAFLFMALLGLAYGFSSTLSGTIWPELYGTKHLGAIRAIIVALMVFCTAAGPGLTGWLIDIGIALPTQMIFMGVYSLLACVLMVFVSRAFQKRIAVYRT